MFATRSYIYHSLNILLSGMLVLWGLNYGAPGLIARMDNAGEDVLLRLRGSLPVDPRIVVVAIDDESIAEIGTFPWRRDVYARLIDRLTRIGARTIALDLLFLDLSPFPAVDRLLGEATRRSGRVVHAMMIERENGPEGRAAKLLLPLPEIARGAAGVGCVSVPWIERNAMIRSMPSNFSNEGHPELFSQAVTAVAHYLRMEPGRIAASLPKSVRLNYRGPWNRRTIRIIPVSRVLDDQLSPEDRGFLRESLVFVGSVSQKAFDHYPSPFGGMMPGAFASVTLADNILNDRALRSLPVVASYLLIAVPVTLFLMALAYLPLEAYLAGILGAALACLAISWLVFRSCFLLTPSATLIALGTSMAWSAFARRRLPVRI